MTNGFDFGSYHLELQSLQARHLEKLDKEIEEKERQISVRRVELNDLLKVRHQITGSKDVPVSVNREKKERRLNGESKEIARKMVEFIEAAPGPVSSQRLNDLFGVLKPSINVYIKQYYPDRVEVIRE